MRKTGLWLGMLAVATCGFAGAQEMKRPAITGIAFARFYTTDEAGSERFYGQTLGYTRQAAGDTSIYPVNRSQWVEVVARTPPKENIRIAAVGFTTEDAAGLERYLAAHGVTAEMPLREGRFSVRDPEGNLVFFVQRGVEKRVAAAAPSPTASSTRMIHVGFIVRDRAKEDTFWLATLGFRPYWFGGQTDARTDYVSMQVPDGTDWLEYMLNVDAVPSLGQAGGSDHISLGVTHMDDAVAALARNRCEGANCAKTQLGRDGKVQLNLFDPDRTRVEFMEFAPRQEPCCSPYMAKHPSADGGGDGR